VLLEQTGFTDIVMSNEVDVFSGSKHESDAKEFDTRGVTVFARKQGASLQGASLNVSGAPRASPDRALQPDHL
jgi:hypothetical protein